MHGEIIRDDNPGVSVQHTQEGFDSKAGKAVAVALGPKVVELL